MCYAIRVLFGDAHGVNERCKLCYAIGEPLIDVSCYGCFVTCSEMLTVLCSWLQFP